MVSRKLFLTALAIIPVNYAAQVAAFDFWSPATVDALVATLGGTVLGATSAYYLASPTLQAKEVSLRHELLITRNAHRVKEIGNWLNHIAPHTIPEQIDHAPMLDETKVNNALARTSDIGMLSAIVLGGLAGATLASAAPNTAQKAAIPAATFVVALAIADTLHSRHVHAIQQAQAK